MHHVFEVQEGIALHDPKLLLSGNSSPQKRKNYPEDIFIVTKKKNNGAGALELYIYDGFSSHTTYVPDAVWEFAALALSINSPRPLLEEDLSHGTLSSAE